MRGENIGPGRLASSVLIPICVARQTDLIGETLRISITTGCMSERLYLPLKFNSSHLQHSADLYFFKGLKKGCRTRVDGFENLIYDDYLTSEAFGSHRINGDAIKTSTTVVPLLKLPP